MSSNIINEINNMQNWTAQQEALKSKTEGTDNTLDQDMFLKLMLEQLKYQDPLNPMSNQDFLAQQAQFTQLEQLQQLNETIEANSGLTQGMDLIGKEVTLMDPDDPNKTITGIVEEAVFYQNGCAVKVNGKEYPAGLILSAKEPTGEVTPPAEGSDSSTDESGTNNNTESGSSETEDGNGVSEKIKSFVGNAAAVSKTAAAFTYLGNLFSGLVDNNKE